jgi:D-lactate dehydrogenase (cytochrome)
MSADSPPNTIATERPRPGSGRPATVIDSPERIRESYADYLRDESRFGPASCDRLVFAHDEQEIAAVLVAAAARGDEVTISAARTGIVGGAVPSGGTLLSLAEMDRILGLRTLPDGRFALRAEPGLSIARLNERLTKKELAIEEATLPDDERRALRAFLTDSRAYFYPPDPTEDTAHLGATLATNASGARSFHYGATRNHVRGLRVCLASGEMLDVERGACRARSGRFVITRGGGLATEVRVPTYAMPATKNAAGYFAAPDMDLIDLFIGSEGTLGVITEATILLAPSPEGTLSALAFFPSDEDAIAFVRRARGDVPEDRPPVSVEPIALEFFDSNSLNFLRERKTEEGSASSIPELPRDAAAAVLFEQEYTEELLLGIYEGWETLLAAHGSSMENTWGGMDAGDLAKLKALRHSIAEEVNNAIARANATCPEIHKIGTDAAVPPSALEEMMGFYRTALEGSGLRYVVFGHIGDSHLHLNIMPRNSDELRWGKELALACAERAVTLGGTVSAEHGIGKLKHAFLKLQYGDAGLREMAAVKAALDPRGVLNRGVMFPGDLLETPAGIRP